MYKEKWYHSPWLIGVLTAFWFLVVPLIFAIILLIQRQLKIKKTRKEWDDSGFGELINLKEKLDALNKEIQLLSTNKDTIMEELKEYESIKDLNKLKQLIQSQIDDLEKQRNKLQAFIEEYKPFSEPIEVKQKINEDIQMLTSKKEDTINEITKIQEKLVDLQDELLMQSFGFYQPKYGFDSSEAYKNKLDDLRKNQKQMVKDKTATHHKLGWVIGDDAKKGKEFILDTIKLTIRAFNNECDNAILKVKYNNIEISEKRIKKVFEDLNKLTDMQQVTISNEYLNLKLEELYLKYEFEQKKQEEREEQLEIKERMREEAQALKELEKAKEKVEKEEKHFELAIDKLNEQIESTPDREKEKLLTKLKELQVKLNETRKNKEDVLYRVQNTRAGYVYVISNIGSFGEDVFKIGMTRRLEPMDRVKELGDASVPFRFDVHAMIFSDDAPTLESELHKAFSHQRVNKVNERKEFFKVQLNDIKEVVMKNHNKTVEFTKLAEAEEYRKSSRLENQLQPSI